MKRFALALTAASLVTPALAADLPSRYAPAPYYEPGPPVFAWTGLYAGINGQLGFGSFEQGGSQLFGTPFGGLGGVTVGYNYQQGSLLVGAEGDIAGGYVGGTGNFGNGISGSGNVQALGTARVRVGYIWDRALIYATGGYAGASMYGKVSDFSNNPNMLVNESHMLNGYAVGAGVEYALTTRLSLKGEYLYANLGSTGFFNGTPDAISSGASLNLVRLGLNYHF